MKRSHACAALAVAVLLLLPGTARAAGAICPSGGVPGPGVTVFGGLEVDGNCVLNNVTIRGGVVIDAAGHLELENSVVYNGIVDNGGELDLGFSFLTNTDTGNPNTVHGGIVINGASDFDIHNVTLDGGLNVVGTINSGPTMCGTTVNGDVNINGATVVIHILIGDPETEGGFTCPGNTINGSVLMSNNTGGVIEVEGNSVTGSTTFVNDVSIEFDGNTIGGSAVCSGTKINPPPGGEPFGNTVKGLINSCPS
jgi:hypothetical protein